MVIIILFFLFQRWKFVAVLKAVVKAIDGFTDWGPVAPVVIHYDASEKAEKEKEGEDHQPNGNVPDMPPVKFHRFDYILALLVVGVKRDFEGESISWPSGPTS